MEGDGDVTIVTCDGCAGEVVQGCFAERMDGTGGVVYAVADVEIYPNIDFDVFHLICGFFAWWGGKISFFAETDLVFERRGFCRGGSRGEESVFHFGTNAFGCSKECEVFFFFPGVAGREIFVVVVQTPKDEAFFREAVAVYHVPDFSR